MTAHNLTEAGASLIKTIETKGTERHTRTNHDVKACELFLRDAFEYEDIGELAEWIHFGLTSEDVNNVAYAIMLQESIDKALLPAIDAAISELRRCAKAYADIPMLARTHGQPASPTTLGKEYRVFAERLARQADQLRRHRTLVKTNGASGNYNALFVAIPDVWWPNFASEHFRRLEGRGYRFEVNQVTTQIEPHDTYAELLDMVKRTCNALIDASNDFWRYISDSWLVQKVVAGETGSSAMPHKVNPINYENAEGNLCMAIMLCEGMSRKLQISRLQRDLSDSTVERNFGSVFAYALIGFKSFSEGLSKVSPNENELRAALQAHPEVVTEAYQTILRSVGYPNAYMVLKDFARGKELTMETLHAFVRSLDVDESVKGRMLKITPENYVGYASQIARE